MTEATGPRPPNDATGALVWRILDANDNRASEGLRVIEDYARYGCDDRQLAWQCKQLRHRLAEALRPVDPARRLAARNASADVGQELTTAAESTRRDAWSVLRANFKRVQQALRSLEEWSKIEHPQAAQEIEQIRYAVYRLESDTERRVVTAARLVDARLYVLIDGGTSAPDFRHRVSQLVRTGVPLIQLREKRLSDRDLLDRCRLLRELTHDTRTRMVVNDRPDIAVAVGADGLHLGQGDLPIAVARRIVGPQMLIGVSTHSLSQAQQAIAEGANYLGVGPTFPTSTKCFDHFPGPTLLREVALVVPGPKFAIGGINLQNLEVVQATGIERVAISSAIWQAADVAAISKQFLNRLAPLHPDDDTP